MSEITPPDPQDIQPVNIEDELRQSYLDYAMSVIVGRALPDVRDGLKPVHKRVLFAMNELNNTYNRPYVKSARVVGDVIGKYHPHGDSAVYDTITIDLHFEGNTDLSFCCAICGKRIIIFLIPEDNLDFMYVGLTTRICDIVQRN